MTTKLQIKTSAYNQRRYSKPWIAKVDFSKNPKGDFAWGSWIGDQRNGSDGLLVIDVEENDIVAKGQKDFRGNNTETIYYQNRNGELVELSGKIEAYQLSINN